MTASPPTTVTVPTSVPAPVPGRDSLYTLAATVECAPFAHTLPAVEFNALVAARTQDPMLRRVVDAIATRLTTPPQNTAQAPLPPVA